MVRAEPAVAQRVQVQRTRQPVLEAAAGVAGLVLEIEVDAVKAGEIEFQQVRVGRACGLLRQAFERFVDPAPPGVAQRLDEGDDTVHAEPRLAMGGERTRMPAIGKKHARGGVRRRP